MRYALLSASFFAFTLPAGAQVTIIGSGLARDCYLSAKLSSFGGREAIETCTKALNHETMSREDRTSTLINRGIIHMRAGDQKSAISDYDRALKMNPDKGEAHLNRGAALIYLQDFVAAKVALDRAIDLESRDLFAAYYNRGLANERLGDFTSAYADFSRSLELNPEFVVAAQQLERFIISKEPADETKDAPA